MIADRWGETCGLWKLPIFQQKFVEAKPFVWWLCIFQLQGPLSGFKMRSEIAVRLQFLGFLQVVAKKDAEGTLGNPFFINTSRHVAGDPERLDPTLVALVGLSGQSETLLLKVNYGGLNKEDT